MTLLQGPKGPLSVALLEALERPGLLAGPVGHRLSRRGPAFALGSCWRLLGGRTSVWLSQQGPRTDSVPAHGILITGTSQLSL